MSAKLESDELVRRTDALFEANMKGIIKKMYSQSGRPIIIWRNGHEFIITHTELGWEVNSEGCYIDCADTVQKAIELCDAYDVQ